MIRLTWVQPEDLVAHELVAAIDEGKEVAAISRRWVQAGGSLEAPRSGASPVVADESARALALDLLDELDELDVSERLRRDEPEELRAIEVACPGFGGESSRRLPARDRVLGAWLGRSAGCLLGKPVEKLPREAIREILEATGRWPLTDWFTAEGLPPDVAARWPWNRRSAGTSLAENIAGMPEDDDLNFALLALRLLETRGHDFTTDDVALAWLADLPAGRVFTAERVAYGNLLLGFSPPRTALRHNPFREWIGAAIRADVHGWTHPGDPAAAARAAWRDARLSHTRSGVYAAMSVAAMCAVAVVADDVDEVLDAGAAVVPPESRYAHALALGRELAESSADDEECLDALHSKFGHLHWVHAVNNGALVAFALSRSRGDLTRAICLAVTGGWDTDSDGATVGSVCGALTGAAQLPRRWVSPLQDRLASSLPGFDGVSFGELADRTLAVVASDEALPAGTLPWDNSAGTSTTVSPSSVTPSASIRGALAVHDLRFPRPIDRPTPVPLDPEADLSGLDRAKILAAPDDPTEWPRWRAQLGRWRAEARRRVEADMPALQRYSHSQLQWTASCRSVALVWLWDELLYDSTACAFTPERLLAAHESFGGLDAVVLWHAYPVIGIDDRNQWDWYRGVPDLQALVASFRSRGVRVFLDFNPWDVGTRRARPDAEELQELVADLRADGVFLDTLHVGPSALVSALSSLNPPPALEGESRLPLPGIANHALSWAQWFADSRYPGVLATRLFDRRHMVHATRRWNRDHHVELQSAWVNGTGILIWESVFGSWVGWNERDKATLRAMRRVQRRFGAHLDEGVWTPLADVAPAAATAAVLGSRFDLDGSTLWTIVNRGDSVHHGAVLRLDASEGTGSWFDVTRGRAVVPHREGDVVLVDAEVPGHGVLGLLRLGDEDGCPGLDDLLAEASTDRGSDDATFPDRPAVRVTAAPAAGRPLEGAIAVAAGEHELPLVFRRRESGMYTGAPFVESWKPAPPGLHDRREELRVVTLGAVLVDPSEVSNGEYEAFLLATGYRPRLPNRFLQHWRAGAAPPGGEDEPVTYLDLDDARAYARWRGARLPTEDEWQAAAASAGESFQRRQPLVWNWTESEHSDGRTRFAMVKGGCAWKAEGSGWYFEGGPQPPEVTAKLLLVGGGLARSSSIGFRCCVDLPAVREIP